MKLNSAKFAPRCGARAIWKSKSLKPDGSGLFGGSKSFSRGRRRDFDTLQNTRQAQEFARVAKTLAGVVDLERVRNDAFRVARARISCSVMSMFEASGAESMEGLQISCCGNVTLQGSFRVAVTGVRMPRLHFFVAGAAPYFGSIHFKIAKTYWNSEAWSTSFLKEVFKVSFLKDISQKSVVFEPQSLKKLRF